MVLLGGHGTASDLLALELSFGLAVLHRDLDAATIVTTFEEMSARGLGLDLQRPLSPTLCKLLSTLASTELLVVGITLSGPLRKLVLAVIGLLPLAKARGSCG